MPTQLAEARNTYRSFLVSKLYQFVKKIHLSSLVETLSGIDANTASLSWVTVYDQTQSFSWLLLLVSVQESP